MSGLLFDGRTRAAWDMFQGRSEAEQFDDLGGGHFSFTVAENDQYLATSGERGELSTVIDELWNAGATPLEIWVAWETLFPEGEFTPYVGGWNYFMQLHERGSTWQSNFAVRVRAYDTPKLEAVIYGGNPAPQIARNLILTNDLVYDHWYKFKFKIRLSTTTGFYKAWVDDQLVLPRLLIPTVYTGGNGVYPKLGYYRPDTVGDTDRIEHRNFRISTNRAGLQL